MMNLGRNRARRGSFHLTSINVCSLTILLSFKCLHLLFVKSIQFLCVSSTGDDNSHLGMLRQWWNIVSKILSILQKR